MGKSQSKQDTKTPSRPPSPYTQATTSRQTHFTTPSNFHHLTHPSTTTSEAIKLPLGRLPDADQLSETRQATRTSQRTSGAPQRAISGAVPTARHHDGESISVTRVKDLESVKGKGCKACDRKSGRLRGGNFIMGQCHERGHKCSSCWITIHSCGRY